MPSMDVPTAEASITAPAETTPALPKELPFPPLHKSHILACSYQSWYPVFRSHTPKARVISLPRTFTAYLRADGIVLPPSRTSTPRAGTPTNHPGAVDDDEGFFSSSQLSSQDSDGDDDDDDEDSDPSQAWPETHASIQATITELRGAVVPKLNWSAPKDATWISATNSMECRTANDIYLLLKSSDFVTHDLEHAFDGCVDFPSTATTSSTASDRASSSSNSSSADQADSIAGATGSDVAQSRPNTTLTTNEKIEILDREIPYVLALRKHFRMNPSLEFRVFVRRRTVMGMTQRDLNHYDFLFSLRPKLKTLILSFWEKEIKEGFWEENYTFDVYVPPPHDRVWIVDFNPWDRRTDPGLWSWLELLTMDDPEPVGGEEGGAVRLYFDGRVENINASGDAVQDVIRSAASDDDDESDSDTASPASDADSDSEAEDEIGGQLDTPGPELRLVQRDDPEAYMFNSTRYSAHKLPREVVDASQSGAGGLREFAEQWKDVLERRSRQANAESDGDDED